MCAQCHSLVHSEKLAQLSTQAKASENANDLTGAKAIWTQSLQLLPYESTQAEWVRRHIYKLELAANAAPPEKKHAWASKLGPLAPVAVLLAKGKFLLTLLKLKFLLSFGAFIAFYWAAFGAAFGIGFVVLIFIHEMGHYVDVKRRGLPADMPVFLPGFGAYVRWQALGVSNETRAAVSLAGPLAGAIAAVACALIWVKTGSGVWAALARSGAWLNVLNLIPIWVLDGGQATGALGKAERWVVLGASVGLWIVLKENVFLLVACGCVYRFFTKDFAPNPSRGIASYYVAVLAVLGVVMWWMPGQGFGVR
ncbi:MAG TPA: site-2 protease family protein [Candidatus Acidoferrum sp.]